MSLMSAEELAALEKDIDPKKESKKENKFKAAAGHFKKIKPGLPGWFGRAYRDRKKSKTKSTLYADPTYQKMAAVSAVVSTYSDAELQQHMIAAGIPDYPDPSTNAVARHLARQRVEADLMDRVYPKEAAYLSAIGSAMPVGEEDQDRLLITGDRDDSDEEEMSIGAEFSDSDEDMDDMFLGQEIDFEDAVEVEIGMLCDAKESTPIDEATKDMIHYSHLSPEDQEEALLEAMKKDKKMEAAHLEADSEKVVQDLEIVFQESLPAELKQDIPTAVEDAFHVALLEEVNKASLKELKEELGEQEKAAVEEMDRKNAFFVSVLEDQKPNKDEKMVQRQSRRLKEAYGKLNQYFKRFGAVKRDKLRMLFGRMSKFVRAIPKQARLKSSYVRKSIGAMAVAASLSPEELQSYDMCGVMDGGRSTHPYAQALIRQRIAADMVAMADVHAARTAETYAAHLQPALRSDIGAALCSIGLSADELQKVKLRRASDRTLKERPVDPQKDLMDSVKDRMAHIRDRTAPGEKEDERMDKEWEVEAPQPKVENATIVPIAPPVVAATAIAKEQQKTEDVKEAVKEAEEVVKVVEDNAEKAAVVTVTNALDNVSDAEAATIPPSVMLSLISSVKKVVEKEEFEKLKGSVKEAAQRKANEELEARVASLTRLLEEKSREKKEGGTTEEKKKEGSVTEEKKKEGVAEEKKVEVFQLPAEASAVVEEEREKRQERVEEAMEKVSSSKKAAAFSFFKDIMGSSSKGTAGFLKEILPSLSSGAAEITSGVTSAGIEGVGNVGVTAASTYADRRAEKKAYRATAEGKADYENQLKAKKERVDAKRQQKDVMKKEKMDRQQKKREAKQKVADEKLKAKQKDGSSKSKKDKTSKPKKEKSSKPKKEKSSKPKKDKSSKTKKVRTKPRFKAFRKNAAFPVGTGVGMGIDGKEEGEEYYDIACGACDAHGTSIVTPMGCRACGASFEDGSEDDSDDDVFEIGASECPVNVGTKMKEGHLCYGKGCPICEFRQRHSKKEGSAPISAPVTIGGSISMATGGSVALVADPLAELPSPVFVLNPWGMFNLMPGYPFSLLQTNVEGDWQFPPAASAARVLGLLQQSIKGTEFAMLCMNRLCLFLTYGPRMNPAIAPCAVELTHRLMEAEMPRTLAPIAVPYSQEEVDWVIAGIGSSFRNFSEGQLWTFVYELILGIIAADDKAATMYRTILAYSPLMSLVEAKKYREANEQRDAYAFVSSKFTSK